MPMVVTICTFLAIVVMSCRKIRGSVFIGILGGMVLYYLLGCTVDGFYDAIEITFISPAEAFGKFFVQSFGKVFTEGLDFSAYTAVHGSVPSKMGRKTRYQKRRLENRISVAKSVRAASIKSVVRSIFMPYAREISVNKSIKKKTDTFRWLINWKNRKQNITQYIVDI